jgi:hypothetical protein
MSMRPVSLLLLMMLSWKAGAVDLIGRTMPPYPAGLEDVGGICLSDASVPGHVCDFSIGFVGDAGADPELEPVVRYIVAGRLSGRDGIKALWQITDALPYPKVAKGFSWQAGNCRVGQVIDDKVVAIVGPGDKQEYLNNVTWAWRLDLSSGKFQVVDPASVDCINEAYGEGP